MVARSLLPFVLGALAWISPLAAAGSCGPPCVAPVPVVEAIPVVVQPASYVTPIYIVNQGPVMADLASSPDRSSSGSTCHLPAILM